MMSTLRAKRDPLDRREFIKDSTAIAGAIGASVASRGTWAKESKVLGNFPGGVGEDSVFIGLTMPLTGPYSFEGDDQLKGCQLAIEQLNSGSDLIKKISPLTVRGVLGKSIRYKSADTETKPNTAIQAASRFIREDKAIMVTGSVSSAVAIALQKLCNREYTVYLTGPAASNDTSGKDCQRYGIHVWTGIYAVAKAVSPVVAQRLGRSRKAVYSVPDYTYGHSTFQSMKEFTEREGWTTIGQQVHPLGTKDFSANLINIANSGADTLVVIDYGSDAGNLIKQAKEFGILDKMSVVVPIMPASLGPDLGPELIKGVYGVVCFWWSLEDRYDVAKDFVQSFRKRFGRIPYDSAFIGYLNIALWADAVERAKSFYPPSVIKAFEMQVHRPSPVGDVWVRAADHQGIISLPVVRGKAAHEMSSPDDIYEIITVVKGEDVAPPVNLFGCKMGDYV